MWALGHLGIGSQLARPWAKGLPYSWLLLGTVLPDLLDKPLYYGLALVTGRHSADLGLLSGTQTIGHTALLWLLVGAVSLVFKSRVAGALALGASTHLLLDGLAEHLFSHGPSQFGYALLFPFFGVRFPVMPYPTFRTHLSTVLNPYILSGEVLGAALLLRNWWKKSI